MRESQAIFAVMEAASLMTVGLIEDGFLSLFSKVIFSEVLSRRGEKTSTNDVKEQRDLFSVEEKLKAEANG